MSIVNQVNDALMTHTMGLSNPIGFDGSLHPNVSNKICFEGDVSPVLESESDQDEPVVTKSGKYRGFPFTDHNVTEENLQWLHTIGRSVGLCKEGTVTPVKCDILKVQVEYMIYSLETCPTTGKRHFQGFIYFKNDQPLTTVIKKMAPRHVETMSKRSSPRMNREYILKGDYVTKADYKKHNTSAKRYGEGVVLYTAGKQVVPIYNAWEFGTCPSNGKRSDIHAIQESIKSGEIKTEKDLAEKSIVHYCQYSKPLMRYMDLVKLDRTVMPKVTIYWGPPGTGKSLYANTNGYVKLFLSGTPDNPFVTGYNGEDKVVLDDFNFRQVSLQWIFNFCDKYAMTFNVKGGSQKCVATDIIFTSNINPEFWWPECNEIELRKAFFRRITNIYEVRPAKESAPMALPIKSDLVFEGLGTDNVTRLESNPVQMTIADIQKLIDENRELKRQNQEYVHVLNGRI